LSRAPSQRPPSPCCGCSSDAAARLGTNAAAALLPLLPGIPGAQQRTAAACATGRQLAQLLTSGPPPEAPTQDSQQEEALATVLAAIQDACLDEQTAHCVTAAGLAAPLIAHAGLGRTCASHCLAAGALRVLTSPHGCFGVAVRLAGPGAARPLVALLERAAAARPPPGRIQFEVQLAADLLFTLMHQDDDNVRAIRDASAIAPLLALLPELPDPQQPGQVVEVVDGPAGADVVAGAEMLHQSLVRRAAFAGGCCVHWGSAPVGPSRPQHAPAGPSTPQHAPAGPSRPQQAPAGPSRPQGPSPCRRSAAARSLAHLAQCAAAAAGTGSAH
jgi:hypothetical protein